MWKKDEVHGPGPNVEPAPRPIVNVARPEARIEPRMEARMEPQVRMTAATGERATIGPSITIRGDVTGNEDLLIQGHVEGTVDLKLHSVTVGPEGKVKANIVGRTVTVEGEVEGDLRGQEQVVLRKTCRVQGNIISPRVALEEGAIFRGNIDMSEQIERSQAARPAAGAHVPAAPGVGAPALTSSNLLGDLKDAAKA